MAVVATMAQSSTSQPNLWKPRYAARQHQEKPQQAQQLGRSRSLREPFDAAELTRKLENYRQELKLEKARRELKQKKADMATAAPVQSAAAQQEVNKPASETQSNSGVQRSKTVHVPNHVMASEQPERRRSIIHRKPKHEIKEESPVEPAQPYVPRVAAKQFANTTTPLKEKKEGQSSTKPSHNHQPEPKPKEVKVKDTSNKHILDWSEPALNTKPASPPLPTSEFPDAEKTQARMHALHAFRDASKSRPRPLSTALENMRWDPNDSNSYVPHPISKPVAEEPKAAPTSYIHPANRPALKLADRHDWSQGSQCGDSARQSLHLFRKKDSVGEEAEIAGLKSGMQRPSKPRQKSHGDASDRLVNDAVKIIRDERRRSILNVFRRH